jgi:hypothetical protein
MVTLSLKKPAFGKSAPATPLLLKKVNENEDSSLKRWILVQGKAGAVLKP